MNPTILKSGFSGWIFVSIFTSCSFLGAMEMDEGIQIGSIFQSTDSPISVGFRGGGLPDSLDEERAIEDLKKIIQTWNRVPCADLLLVLAAENSTADIGIFWGDSDNNSCIPSEKDIGFTYFSPCANGDTIYERNSILLNANLRFEWRHEPAPYQDAKADHIVDLRSVLTHEIGHALGLQHSDIPLATMRAKYILDGGMSTLAADDKFKLCAIYPTGKNECEREWECGNGKCVERNGFKVCEEERNAIGEYCALDDLRCEICLQTSVATYTGYCSQSCSVNTPCPGGFICSGQGFCQFDSPEPSDEGCSTQQSPFSFFPFLFLLGCWVSRRR